MFARHIDGFMHRCIGFRGRSLHAADDGGVGGPGNSSPAGGAGGARRNRLEIIFLACWLGAWTLGILWSVADWPRDVAEGDSGDAAFLRTRLLPALAAWIAAAAYLVWLLRGGKSLTGWWISRRAPARVGAREGERPSGTVRRDWVMIILVSVFFAGWTVAVITAFGMLILVMAMGEPGMVLFLVFWLIAAIVGWFVILRLIRHLYGGGSAWMWNPWTGQ